MSGGAGFIGSHLTNRLVELGHTVLILDDFSSASGLPLISNKSDVQICRGDILNYNLINKLVRKVDEVYHLAVRCLPESLVDPLYVHKVNDLGTFNICMATKEHKKKLVYISSSEVYGSARYVPMDETHPLEPTTPYGASKACGEMIAKGFFHAFNLPVIIARPFNTYGPYMREDSYASVIHKFVKNIKNNKPPIIYGNGEQTRDFTYISDVVKGIVLAAESEKMIGETVNIARGEEVSINKIAKVIIDIYGKNIKPVYTKPRPGDVRRHLASIEKAKKLLSFNPKISVEEGIKRYIMWDEKRE